MTTRGSIRRAPDALRCLALLREALSQILCLLFIHPRASPLTFSAVAVTIVISEKSDLFETKRFFVIVYRSGLTKGTGVLSGARRIDVTMSITRIPL